MIRGIRAYYVSRTVLSMLVGILLVLTGSPWWSGMLIAAVAFGWFLAAPHIGRYSVHPEFGITALRRDERSRAINDKAARNAFVVSMLALGALVAYSTGIGTSSLPVAVFKWILILGVIVYYVTDFWVRKAHA